MLFFKLKKSDSICMFESERGIRRQREREREREQRQRNTECLRHTDNPKTCDHLYIFRKNSKRVAFIVLNK